MKRMLVGAATARPFRQPPPHPQQRTLPNPRRTRTTMTNLNMITHLNTSGSYYLPLAEGINSRGEIVGYAVDQRTGDTLGFSAVPCDNVLADNQSCADRGRNALGTDEQKAVWPEIALGPLRSRRGVGVFGRWPSEL